MNEYDVVGMVGGNVPIMMNQLKPAIQQKLNEHGELKAELAKEREKLKEAMILLKDTYDHWMPTDVIGTQAKQMFGEWNRGYEALKKSVGDSK